MVKKCSLIGISLCVLLLIFVFPFQQTAALSVSISVSGGCGSTFCIGEYIITTIQLNENAYADIWVVTATSSWYNRQNEYLVAGTHSFDGTIAAPEGTHTIYIRARNMAGNIAEDSCSYYVVSCGSTPTPPQPTPSPDSDGDGVKDSSDQCYNPQCNIIDSKGCPKDSDSDGVDDCDDDCRYESGPASNDGCPEEAGDRDSDGVNDDRDSCYNPGCSIVDSQGCPKDSDSDGVDDCDDDCRYESGPASNDGCPEEAGDRDSDGVNDDRDSCYNPGCSIVDSQGCPKDSDSDGVDDCDDDCRYESGPASNDGCPANNTNILKYWWIIALLFCVLAVLLYLNKKRPPKLKM